MSHGWIKMRRCLGTHPKVVRTASALKEDKARVIGAYALLWFVADEHTVDGRLEGYSVDDVDAVVGVPGFALAAASVGWLILEPEAVVIPGFETHNGQSAKRRAQEANRKSEARKASAPRADKKRTRSDQIREELDIDPIEGASVSQPSASRADKLRRDPVEETTDGDGLNIDEGGDQMFFDADVYEKLKPPFQRVADMVRVGRNPLNDADRDTVIRCVVVAARRLPQGELDAIIRRVRRAFETTKVQSRIGFFKSAVVNACTDAGVDYHFAAKFDLPHHSEQAAQQEAVA